MYKDMLPVGSVVLLAGGTKRLMICGRIMTRKGEDKIYDYAGCLYPEGIMDSSRLYFFDRDEIETIFFIGFQDIEGLDFQREVLDGLGDLEVRDGKIQPKQ